VIRQGFRDALWRPTRTSSSSNWRAEQRRLCERARWFLQSSDELRIWCTLAGLDADRVREAITSGLLDRKRRRAIYAFGGWQCRSRRRRRAA
jgi:hypothetical protein